MAWRARVAADPGRHRGVRGGLVHPRRGARERHPIRHLPACRRGRAHARREAVRALASRRTPTPAGLRYYRRCVEAVGLLESADEEVRGFAGRVTGDLRIGLMPTLTRAALAPTLEHFVPRYPDVRLHIVEGYSGLLTDMVLADELDFAVVPTFEGRVGLNSRLLVRDREMLLSGPEARPRRRSRRCGSTIAGRSRSSCPARANVRRRNLETYFQTHGVEVADMIEMDAMIGTLEFVARSDWVAMLPGLICVNDIDRNERVINPIYRPAAVRRVRGDRAGAAYAVDAGAAVPRALRGGDRAHPGGLGAHHSADQFPGAERRAPKPASATLTPARPAASADARARTHRSACTRRRCAFTVGKASCRRRRTPSPTAWPARQMSASVTASPWQYLPVALSRADASRARAAPRSASAAPT